MDYTQKPVTIANAAAVSDAVDLLGYRLVGARTASAWTAADLTPEVDPDGSGTFYRVSDKANALLRLDGVAVDTVALFDSDSDERIVGAKVRLRSVNVGSEADVNQGAARSLVLLLAK